MNEATLELRDIVTSRDKTLSQQSSDSQFATLGGPSRMLSLADTAATRLRTSSSDQVQLAHESVHAGFKPDGAGPVGSEQRVYVPAVGKPAGPSPPAGETADNQELETALLQQQNVKGSPHVPIMVQVRRAVDESTAEVAALNRGIDAAQPPSPKRASPFIIYLPDAQHAGMLAEELGSGLSSVSSASHNSPLDSPREEVTTDVEHGQPAAQVPRAAFTCTEAPTPTAAMHKDTDHTLGDAVHPARVQLARTEASTVEAAQSYALALDAPLSVEKQPAAATCHRLSDVVVHTVHDSVHAPPTAANAVVVPPASQAAWIAGGSKRPPFSAGAASQFSLLSTNLG
ncbi:MAG: hypothetical protein EOO65_06010, partial [Methanosarcinales archaeon]